MHNERDLQTSPTLIQRFLRRLTEPDVGRYSAIIEQRSFGRGGVSLPPSASSTGENTDAGRGKGTSTHDSWVRMAS